MTDSRACKFKAIRTAKFYRCGERSDFFSRWHVVAMFDVVSSPIELI